MVAMIIVVLFAIRSLAASPSISLANCSTFSRWFTTSSCQQADEIIGHHDGPKYVAFAGTLFIFVLFGNLIGVIPSFESPTMFAACPSRLRDGDVPVPTTSSDIGANGFGYLKHFTGPIPWLAPLMFPIEIISHLARPMSLTIRLFANMLAGEKVTLVFLSLTYFLVPAVFMGLHVFVSLVQAFIFMVLTMIYIGGAVSHEEH